MAVECVLFVMLALSVGFGGGKLSAVNSSVIDSSCRSTLVGALL